MTRRHSGAVAFNPQTFLHRPDAGWRPHASRRNNGTDVRYSGPLLQEWLAAPAATGRLVAWDPIAQAARWRVDLPVVSSGGVLTTAGNLVFQGRSDGRFVAYRSTDGTVWWELDAGTGIMAPPVTFEVDGTQHLTLIGGFAVIAHGAGRFTRDIDL